MNLKRLILIPVFFFIFFQAHSQIRSSQWVINTQFNVNLEHPSNTQEVQPDWYHYYDKVTSLNYDVSGVVSYAITKNWVLGAGLMYGRESMSFINEDESYFNQRKFYSSAYSPTIQFEYVGEVAKNLYITGMLSVAYTFTKHTSFEEYRNTDVPPPYDYNMEEESYHTQAYAAFLSPTIRYNFLKWMGLQFVVGQIGVDRMVKDESGETKPEKLNFRANLKPSAWRLGVYFNFGK